MSMMTSHFLTRLHLSKTTKSKYLKFRDYFSSNEKFYSLYIKVYDMAKKSFLAAGNL